MESDTRTHVDITCTTSDYSHSKDIIQSIQLSSLGRKTVAAAVCKGTIDYFVDRASKDICSFVKYIYVYIYVYIYIYINICIYIYVYIYMGAYIYIYIYIYIMPVQQFYLNQCIICHLILHEIRYGTHCHNLFLWLCKFPLNIVTAIPQSPLYRCPLYHSHAHQPPE